MFLDYAIQNGDRVDILDENIIVTSIIITDSRITKRIDGRRVRHANAPAQSASPSLAAAASAVISFYKEDDRAELIYNLYRFLEAADERVFGRIAGNLSIEGQIKYYTRYAIGFSEYSEEILHFHQRYQNLKAFW